MDILLFFVRYIPFWAVPIIFIAGEFGHLYWLKGNRLIAYISAGIILFCVAVIFYYILAGGPEKSVKNILYLLNS